MPEPCACHGATGLSFVMHVQRSSERNTAGHFQRSSDLDRTDHLLINLEAQRQPPTDDAGGAALATARCSRVVRLGQPVVFSRHFAINSRATLVPISEDVACDVSNWECATGPIAAIMEAAPAPSGNGDAMDESDSDTAGAPAPRIGGWYSLHVATAEETAECARRDEAMGVIAGSVQDYRPLCVKYTTSVERHAVKMMRVAGNLIASRQVDVTHEPCTVFSAVLPMMRHYGDRRIMTVTTCFDSHGAARDGSTGDLFVADFVRATEYLPKDEALTATQQAARLAHNAEGPIARLRRKNEKSMCAVAYRVDAKSGTAAWASTDRVFRDVDHAISRTHAHVHGGFLFVHGLLAIHTSNKDEHEELVVVFNKDTGRVVHSARTRCTAPFFHFVDTSM